MGNFSPVDLVKSAVGGVFSSVVGNMIAQGSDKSNSAPAAPIVVQAKDQTKQSPAKTPEQASDAARKKAALISKKQSSILTSPLGLLEPASTARPLLLGR